MADSKLATVVEKKKLELGAAFTPQARVQPNLNTFEQLSEYGKDLTSQQVQTLNTAISIVNLIDRSFVTDVKSLADQKKLFFFATDHAEKVAAAAGDKNFSGDAYTASMAIKDPNGKIKGQIHQVFVENWTLDSNFGQAIVTLHHELTHVRRFNSGRSSPNRAKEEIETYQESMAIMKALSSKLREEAQKNPDSRDLFNRVAGQIDTALKKDQEYLKGWQTRK